MDFVFGLIAKPCECYIHLAITVVVLFYDVLEPILYRLLIFIMVQGQLLVARTK